MPARKQTLAVELTSGATVASYSETVVTMLFLDLPDELLAYIGTFLHAPELIQIQQVCSRLRDVVTSHPLLQYTIELYATGTVDNPASSLVPGEKLRKLREKEDAWRSIDLSPSATLSVSYNPSGIYDLTGGTILLGERGIRDGMPVTDNVRTAQLEDVLKQASDRQSSTLWRKIDVGKSVIDVGLAIQEHDLIAVVTYS